jgi:hypothetical protein
MVRRKFKVYCSMLWSAFIFERLTSPCCRSRQITWFSTRTWRKLFCSRRLSPLPLKWLSRHARTGITKCSFTPFCTKKEFFITILQRKNGQHEIVWPVQGFNYLLQNCPVYLGVYNLGHLIDTPRYELKITRFNCKPVRSYLIAEYRYVTISCSWNLLVRSSCM